MAFQFWFAWASPIFAHNDDSSKKVITFPSLWCRSNRVHSGAIATPRKFHGVSYALKIWGNDTVAYGNTASPDASSSRLKHSCVLRPCITSIFIQERCSSFINMILVRSHYLYESQRSIQCNIAVDWHSTVSALTHLTVLIRVHKAGSSRNHHRHVRAVLPVLSIQSL